MRQAIAILLVLLFAAPAYAAAPAVAPPPDSVASDALGLFLVFDRALAIRVPTNDMTWTITPDEEVRIHHPTGQIFAAVRPSAPIGVAGRLVELPRDHFDQVGTQAATMDADACDTGSLGMYVCADITYNGGSSPIWHHGSVENVPSNHQCLSGTGCLRIQGCTHVSCPNEAWFWVQPDATYASVCWTWRAWTYVNARATYAGVSPATGDVFPSWWTTC